MYIITKRFKGKAIFGEANLRYGTVLAEKNGYLLFNGEIMFAVTSENAHEYATINIDGHGKKRRTLINSIQKTLRDNTDLWGKVVDDEVCQKYNRKDFPDYWLWNHNFYEAPIEDLEYIANLIST